MWISISEKSHKKNRYKYYKGEIIFLSSAWTRIFLLFKFKKICHCTLVRNFNLVKFVKLHYVECICKETMERNHYEIDRVAFSKIF